MRFTGLVLCLAVLSGCGAIQFKPTEYPLRDGLIPPFKSAGAVTVSNDQPADAEFIVYSYGGSQLVSNLKAITDVMVEQTRKEIAKNGQASPGSAKTIALKVNSLLSRYGYAMFWRSTIQFEAKLGNGQVLSFDVPHSSGSVHQNLNGNIAEGVMKMLNDERVRAYLGS